MYLTSLVCLLLSVACAQAQVTTCTFGNAPGYNNAPFFAGQQISDLRTPTPYTLTNWYTVSDCAASPTFGTVYLNATLANTTYTANPVTYSFDVYTGTFSVSYVFEDILMTMMYPGETIPMLETEYTNGVIVGTLGFTVTVPASALAIASSTVTSTSTSSSFTTPPSSLVSSTTFITSTGNTGGISGGEIGGIVVGAIVTLIIVAAMIAFACVKARKIDPSQQYDPHAQVSDIDHNVIQPAEPKEEISSGRLETVSNPPSGRLRYDFA